MPRGTDRSLTRPDDRPVGWAVSPGLVGYLEAVGAMEARAAMIADGRAGEMVWLLEHPALYTAGVSAPAEELLDPGRLPVFQSGRGGRFTYHGPGQRVAYVMLDVGRRGRDVRAFVAGLELWLIGALARLGVRGETRDGRVGVWVQRPEGPAALPPAGRDAKIAAVGVKLRRWVSFHGVSLNVAPDLAHFAGIVPCGIDDCSVTSLADLGSGATAMQVDLELKASFEEVFGPVEPVSAPAAPGNANRETALHLGAEPEERGRSWTGTEWKARPTRPKAISRKVPETSPATRS